MVRSLPPSPDDARLSGADALRASEAAWKPGLHAIGTAQAIRAVHTLRCEDIAARAAAEFWAGRHLQVLGELDRALAHAKRGLDVSTSSMFDLRADLHALAALCFSELGDQAAGVAQAELALGCGVEHDSPRIQSVALARLGLCRWRQGDTVQAESILFRALSFAREANRPEEVLAAISGLVGVSIAAHEQATAHGDLDGARAALARACTHAGRAVRTSLRANDRDSWLKSLNNQAKCLTMAGQLAEAEAILRRVIAQSDARGLRLLAMRARYNLALALMEGAREAQAIGELTAVLEMLDQTEHLPLRRVCRGALATAAARADLTPR
jgi:tetratricopeptide (TPR) repeat protein